MSHREIPHSIKMVHVNDIVPGDTVVIDGTLKTVCRENIKQGGFCGTTLFGDSYRMGTVMVKKAIIAKQNPTN